MWKKEDANSESHSTYAHPTLSFQPNHGLKPFKILEKDSQKVTDFKSVARLYADLKWDDEYPSDNQFPAYRTIRSDQVKNLLATGLSSKSPHNSMVTPWRHANFAEDAKRSSYISFTKDSAQAAGWSSTDTTSGEVVYLASHHFIQATFPTRSKEKTPYFLDLSYPMALAAQEDANPKQWNPLVAIQHNQQVLIRGVLTSPYITKINYTHSLTDLDDIQLVNNLRTFIPSPLGCTFWGGTMYDRVQKISLLQRENSAERLKITKIFPRFNDASDIENIVDALSNMRIVNGYTDGKAKKQGGWNVAVDTIYSNPNLFKAWDVVDSPDMLNSAEVLIRHGITIPERPNLELSEERKTLDDLGSIKKKSEQLIETGETFFGATTSAASKSSAMIKTNTVEIRESRAPSPIVTPLSYVNREQTKRTQIVEESKSPREPLTTTAHSSNAQTESKKSKRLRRANNEGKHPISSAPDEEKAHNRKKDTKNSLRESPAKGKIKIHSSSSSSTGPQRKSNSTAVSMESLAAMPSIKRKRAESEAIPNNTTPLKSHKNNQSDIATSKQTVPTQLRPSAINMGKGCSLDQKTQPKEIQKQSFLDEIHEKGRRKTDTPPEFRSIK